jgi:hypothetical protein
MRSPAPPPHRPVWSTPTLCLIPPTAALLRRHLCLSVEKLLLLLPLLLLLVPQLLLLPTAPARRDGQERRPKSSRWRRPRFCHIATPWLHRIQLYGSRLRLTRQRPSCLIFSPAAALLWLAGSGPVSANYFSLSPTLRQNHGMTGCDFVQPPRPHDLPCGHCLHRPPSVLILIQPRIYAL